LQRYYRVPKQPFLNTVRYLEQTRQADEVLVAVAPSGMGLEYYAQQEGWAASNQFIPVGADSTLAALLAKVSPRPVRIVTTLERVAKKTRSPIFARLRADWKRDTTFAATVGDGELTVWSRRQR